MFKKEDLDNRLNEIEKEMFDLKRRVTSIEILLKDRNKLNVQRPIVDSFEFDKREHNERVWQLILSVVNNEGITPKENPKHEEYVKGILRDAEDLTNAYEAHIAKEKK